MGTIRLEHGGYAHAAYMACSAIRRPYGEVAPFTTFLERSGINMPAISEQAKSEADYGRRLDRAMVRALRDDPSLIAYAP